MTYTQKKILFFTAAAIATTQENTDMNIMSDLGFRVCARNTLAYANGKTQGGTLETADYAMDSASGANIPASFSGVPVASKTAPPAPPVLSTQKVITSGVLYTSPAPSGSRVTGYNPTIVAGAVTAQVGG